MRRSKNTFLIGILKYVFATAAVLLIAAGAYVTYLRFARPNLERYGAYFAKFAAERSRGGDLTATYLGTATVLLSDGGTSLMTDGFFTRPGGALRLLAGGEVAPDPEVIARGLERAGAEDVGAVLVVHSHYDHAMDAPEVAKRTGALLVGSESTSNVGRGWGLREERIRVVEPGDPLRFGGFTVTFVVSKHVPLPFGGGDLLGTRIEQPLVPPAPVTAYKEGVTYSVLVEHSLGSTLIQGSAGFVPGALRGYSAEVAFLSIAGLAAQGREYAEAYFRETAGAVGAKRVVPIHWDDFTIPLAEFPLPLPRLADDVDRSLEFLIEQTRATGGSVVLLPAWRPVALFPAGS